MAYSECLSTHLNPLAERTCFSQVRDEEARGGRRARAGRGPAPAAPISNPEPFVQALHIRIPPTPRESMYSTCSTIRSGAGLDSGCERTRRCGRSSCHSSRTSWRVRNKGRKYATRVRYTSCPHNHSALSLPRVRTRIVERASRVHPLGSTRCTSTAALMSHNKIDAIPLFIGFADSKRQYLFHWTCRLMPCMVGPI